MTTIKNLFIGAFWMLAIICMAFGLVWLLTYIGVDASSKPPPHEVQFIAVCDRLHGTTVWNGKQLECLK